MKVYHEMANTCRHERGAKSCQEKPHRTHHYLTLTASMTQKAPVCPVTVRNGKCVADAQGRLATLQPLGLKLAVGQSQEVTFDHSEKYGIISLANAHVHISIDVHQQVPDLKPLFASSGVE